MELLFYMYTGKLSSTTVPALLNLLRAADKFQVASCMSLCSQMLMNQPMREVLTYNDDDLATKAILNTPFFKVETPDGQLPIALDKSDRLVKVVALESPYQQCIVYLDLKRIKCAKMFPTGNVRSQAFHLGGQDFFLSARCNMDQHNSSYCFGLFVGMLEKRPVSFTVDYEFAARMRPSGEFVSKSKGYYTFTDGHAMGNRNLFDEGWTSIIAEVSPYFVNSVLHLRAELTLKQVTQQQAH